MICYHHYHYYYIVAVITSIAVAISVITISSSSSNSSRVVEVVGPLKQLSLTSILADFSWRKRLKDGPT